MKRLAVSAGVLLLSVLCSPDILKGQTEKVFERTYEGRVVQAPYMTFDAFKSASLGRGKPRHGKVSTDTSSQEVAFSELLSAASLDQFTQHLGKPQSLDQNNLVREGTFIAHLHYEGLELEYLKAERNGKVLLRDLTITSDDWSITVNGRRVYVGMSASKLSKPVQRSMQTTTKGAAQEGSSTAVIHLGDPKSAGNAKTARPQTERNLGITVDASGRVAEILFHRVI